MNISLGKVQEKIHIYFLTHIFFLAWHKIVQNDNITGKILNLLLFWFP